MSRKKMILKLLTVIVGTVIRKKYNPFLESFNIGEYKSNDSEYMAFKTLGINPTQIIIRGIPYEVVHPIFAVRSRNVEDNYYRFIYIQINYETGEYYIGKVKQSFYVILSPTVTHMGI